MAQMNYETIWEQMRVRSPDIWPTWPVIAPYAEKAKKRLEIGAGVLPKFPIQGTYFLDTSKKSVEKLQVKGGKGAVLSAEDPFPFGDGFFDLVGAFEVLEHLQRPEEAIKEVARVLQLNGMFLFSSPVHQRYWSQWDTFAGHVRRFEIEPLGRMLTNAGFVVECCYVFRKAGAFKVPFANVFGKVGRAVLSRFAQARVLDACFFLFIRLSRATTKPEYFAALPDVPSNALALFVVCRKVQK